MKSKSPFAMKSPLLAYKSDQRGNYANPEYVPRVDVGAAVGAHVAKTAADVFSSISQADKAKQKAATDKASGGSNVNNQTVNVYGSGSGSGGKKEYKFDHDFGKTKITPDPPRFPGSKGTPTNETSIPPSTPDDKYNTKLRTQETAGRKVEKLETNKETYLNSFNAGFVKNNEGYDNIDDYIKFKESKYQPKKQMFARDYKNNVVQGDEYEVDIDNQKTNYSVMNMKGSPNKLIGDTMDPYGQINPGAVPPNQAQNDLGAQPIIGAQGSQPSARAIDMAAIENPYATPGADFNPQSKMKAESIFGSAGQRQGLMNLGTPLHDKGHADDYEGHTHRKKGGSYKEGDYMDETDMETSYPKLYTQDVGEIKRDKKSQFMVSKNEDYSPTKIDTIRPLKGKEFKMGWGDAERNISTNPKYKKSK